MRQLKDISQERETMGVIVELTGALEGIASMRIASIKDQVQSSSAFFGELWKIYSQIRVDELFHFGRSQSVADVSDKELMILITSEGSFSGDIDQKLIAKALEAYNDDSYDVIVVGHHGAVLLSQANIKYKRSFKMPEKDRNINVMPLVAEAQKYSGTIVYYQAYVSLTRQDIRHMRLSDAVAERGRRIEKGEEIITEHNYIFEPSTYEVVDHLERSMMQITLSEVILESKLAQYASRFKAMTLARDRAEDSFSELSLVYSRSRRHLKDERLKEVINGLRWAEL